MKKDRRALTAFSLLALIIGSTLPSLADEAAVLVIRESYQAIEDRKDWVVKSIDAPTEDSTEVTAITRYEEKDGTLKKLVVKTLNHDGLATERYYFSKGLLFYIFRESEYLHYTWRSDKNGEQRSTGAPQRGLQEHRLYYAGEKCVRQLRKEAVGADQGEAVTALAKSKNKQIDDASIADHYRERGAKLAKTGSNKRPDTWPSQ